MSVTYETTSDGRVAVLHGVDTDAALRHLARSLVVGVAFGDCRGLVIDLGGRQPSAVTVDLLGEAGRARLRRQQVVTAAADAREVRDAVLRVREWMERADQSSTGVSALIAQNFSAVRSVVEAGISVARNFASCLLPWRPSS